jgi:DNA-binding transcriptional LysR family regulator
VLYDITSLDLFITVAEERNLTRAARLKHLAVSAISKRISESEAQVGAPLLTRNARGGLDSVSQCCLCAPGQADVLAARP